MDSGSKSIRYYLFLLKSCLVMAFLGIHSTASLAQSQGSIDLAQQMFVAYYGRPGDPGGTAFWAGKFDQSSDLNSVLSAFGDSLEYSDNFGTLNNEQLVSGLFQQMFNRDSDSAGLAFYVGRLESGAATLASIAKQIADGSVGDDLLTLNNKIAVANAFTNQIEADGIVYEGADIPAARAIIASVNSSVDALTDGSTSIMQWVVGKTVPAERAQVIAAATSCDDTLSGCLHIQLNGSVAAANIQVSLLADPDNVVYEGQSWGVQDWLDIVGAQSWNGYSASLQLSLVGIDPANLSQLDPNEFYLVTVSGGQDSDNNLDLQLDEQPETVNGDWHALVQGQRLMDGAVNVSVLTEALYRYYQPELSLPYWSIQAALNNAAKLMVSQVDEDDDVDYDDVLEWSRTLNMDKYLGTAEELAMLTGAIISGADLGTMKTAIFAAVEASDTPMTRAVAGDTSTRRYDYTLNPLPDSILIDSSLFTVSEIAQVHDTYSAIWYHGAGDTDADGNPEIYISGWTNHGPDETGLPPKSIFVGFEARPDATVQLPTEQMFGRSTTDGTAFIRVADFNLDGLEDVLVAGHNEVPFVDTENVLYLNQGGGTFGANTFGPYMAQHEGNTGDFNGDGYPDFIASAYEIDLDFSDDPLAAGDFGALTLFLNNTAGGFDAWPLRFNMATQGVPDSQIDGENLRWINSGSAAAFGNIDADSATEIVLVDNDDGALNKNGSLVIDNIRFEESYIYGDIQELPRPFLNAKEEFQAAVNESDSYSPSHDVQTDLMDFDNDGDNDILVFSMIWNREGLDTAGVMQLLQNDGSGNFTDVTEQALFNYNTGTQGGHEIRYIDVNRDGFMDIVSAEESYVEAVEKVWPTGGGTGDLYQSIDRSWGNMILINTGNGKFVVTMWEGYNDFTLDIEEIFVSYGSEFEPYSLVRGRTFPYVLADGRLGFITSNRGHPDQTFFFDIRAEELIYTGPKGTNPADRGAPGYNEYYYLTENPDVSAMVGNGEYPDGLTHFLDIGKSEGRRSYAEGAIISP